MRRWILVAGVAVAAMLATACSSSGGTSSSSTSGPVTLTIWHNYGTEGNAVATNNLVGGKLAGKWLSGQLKAGDRVQHPDGVAEGGGR